MIKHKNIKKICLTQEYEQLFIFLLTALINLVVLVILVWGLWRSNNYEHKVAHEKVMSITHHTEQEIVELIKKNELIQFALRDEITIQEKNGGKNKEKIDAHIKRNFDRFPELVNLIYADAKGYVYSDAAGASSPQPLASKLNAFQFHLKSDAKGIYISPPFLGPIVHEWVLLFSSRVNKLDGRFGGAIGSSIKLLYLQSLFSNEEIGANGVVELRNHNASIIVKHSNPEASIAFSPLKGEAKSKSERLIRAKNQQSVFLETSPYDGVERLVSLKKLDNHPLYIRVGLSTDDYLSSWYEECLYAAGFYLLFLIITTLLSYKLNQNRKKRLLAEDKLYRAARVFSDTHDGIIITDLEGKIIDVNAAFINITGYSREELIGQNPRILKSGQHDTNFYKAMWQTLRETGEWSGQVWNRNKGGEVYADLLKINAVYDGKGKKQNYIGMCREVTKMMENEQELKRMAHYDALTGLLNRSLLDDRLQQALAHARRNKTAVAVAYVDLDGFKEVNDRFGHHVGDDLLVEVSRQMKQALREVDALIRLGGDEFLIIMGDIDSQENCEIVLNRVLTAISRASLLVSKEAKVSASIGATIYPLIDTETSLMVKHADEAMYQAKHMGKNRLHFYKPE